MSNLRVLHYTTWREPCGIAGYAESLVNALTALGVQNTVHGITRKGMRAAAPAEFARELATFCEQACGHDVAHLQHEFAFFTTTGDLVESNRNFGSVLAHLIKSGTPTVVTCHTEPTFLTTPMRRRERLRWLLRRGGVRRGWELEKQMQARPGLVKLIVHARKTRAAFVNTGVPAEHVEVLPIGFDERAPHVGTADAARAKQELGLPPDCVLLSLFGFVAQYKGHEVAVRALKALPEQYYLAVVGGPHPEGDGWTVDRILRAWGRRDPRRLIITGFVEQAQLDLYHAATDICLAPYLDDTQSSSAAITWALTSGKPVIASNIRAFRELYETVPCMALVTPGAAHELAWQVQRVAGSSRLRQELAANALRLARQYSWEQIARRTVGVYEAARSAACAVRRSTPAAA